MAAIPTLNTKKTGIDTSEDDKTSNKGSEGSMSNAGTAKKRAQGHRQQTLNRPKNLDRNKASYPLDEIKKIFDKTSEFQKLNKQKFEEYLQGYYKEGLTKKLLSILSSKEYFDSLTKGQTQFKLEDYQDKMERLFNMDERKLKELAFQIFDCNNDKKVSENDMFELMRITSGVKGGYVNMFTEMNEGKMQTFIKDQQLISYSEQINEKTGEKEKKKEIRYTRKLGEPFKDIFLDIFSRDYIKVIKKIDNKRQTLGITADTDMRKDGATPKVGLSKKMKKEPPKISTNSEMDVSERDEAAEKVVKKPKKSEKEDLSIGLDINEFCQIQFDMDWPMIIKHLAIVLVGKDIMEGRIVNEADEYDKKEVTEMCKE